MPQYSDEFIASSKRYVVKMKGIQISTPNEFIGKGLDGFKEYANKLKVFYPLSVIEIWEVSEKLIEY